MTYTWHVRQRQAAIHTRSHTYGQFRAASWPKSACHWGGNLSTLRKPPTGTGRTRKLLHRFNHVKRVQQEVELSRRLCRNAKLPITEREERYGLRHLQASCKSSSQANGFEHLPKNGLGWHGYTAFCHPTIHLSLWIHSFSLNFLPLFLSLSPAYSLFLCLCAQSLTLALTLLSLSVLNRNASYSLSLWNLSLFLGLSLSEISLVKSRSQSVSLFKLNHIFLASLVPILYTWTRMQSNPSVTTHKHDPSIVLLFNMSGTTVRHEQQKPSECLCTQPLRNTYTETHT